MTTTAPSRVGCTSSSHISAPALIERRRKPVRITFQQQPRESGPRKKSARMPNSSPTSMQRASASRRSYTRAIFRTHAHLADEAAGILVAGGALGCAVAGMKLPRAREDKTVALEAY